MKEKSLMTEQSKLEGTAYHEAGHAIVCRYLGIPFEYVTVERNEETNSAGHVFIPLAENFDNNTGISKIQSIENVKKLVVIAYAGVIAQKKFSGAHDEIGFSGDQKEIDNYVLLLNENLNDGLTTGLQEIYKLLSKKSKKIVFQKWNEIEALARALIKEETLSYEEVEKLLNNLAQLTCDT
jgi:ATP-dependent Zn protease